MKIRFDKGDAIVATDVVTREQFTFVCPSDNMCKFMLQRYVVMRLGYPVKDYLFTKQ